MERAIGKPSKLLSGGSQFLGRAGAGATYPTRYSLRESKDGETTEVSASFEVQPNNLFSKVFVKLIGKKLLGSTGETLQNDLSDLANAEERA